MPLPLFQKISYSLSILAWFPISYVWRTSCISNLPYGVPPDSKFWKGNNTYNKRTVYKGVINANICVYSDCILLILALDQMRIDFSCSWQHVFMRMLCGISHGVRWLLLQSEPFISVLWVMATFYYTEG